MTSPVPLPWYHTWFVNPSPANDPACSAYPDYSFDRTLCTAQITPSQAANRATAFVTTLSLTAIPPIAHSPAGCPRQSPTASAYVYYRRTPTYPVPRTQLSVPARAGLHRPALPPSCAALSGLPDLVFKTQYFVSSSLVGNRVVSRTPYYLITILFILSSLYLHSALSLLIPTPLLPPILSPSKSLPTPLSDVVPTSSVCLPS